MTYGTPPSGPNDNPETGARQRDGLPPRQGEPHGAAGAPHDGPPRAARRRPSVVALVLALLGAALAVVGLFAVRWTKVPSTSSTDEGPKFLDLRRVFVALDKLNMPNEPTFTITYFNYAAFVLLGLAFLFAVLSALPTPAAPAFRVLGFIVGLVSAAAALLVPALDDSKGLSEYLKGGLGLYLVAGGSLLMAIASLAGTRGRD